MPRYGSSLVGHTAMAGLTRQELEDAYARLYDELVATGLDPVVSPNILDVLDDGELRALIKDSVLRLIRFRRIEGEL